MAEIIFEKLLVRLLAGNQMKVEQEGADISCLQFETTAMKQFFLLAFFVFTLIGVTAFVGVSHVDQTKSFHNHLKKKSLGISIVLYQVGKAEKIDDLSDLEKQMDKSKSVNLYKATQDLAIIFMNTADPYSNTAALSYKMLFGAYVEKQVGDKIINGFVPTPEVATVCDWMKKHRIDSFEGFSKMYESLSKEAKQELEDIGADDKKHLFEGYVRPLTQFYLTTLKNHNAIVICGE
ncbi:hypothetical protein [Flavisolibacter ginsenosidimutans]|uniref:Uncharacterized protein n=1 Tax=Flavisolibacter ginsenosidimutans TaxID=661481 RepID=A0A5B8UK41_9BACT|nr:hypothetical protein [Flavisolibacter ginsenosidimutans]QEC56918.1 hypothetical protein FSB75_13760 [Flavisolibacter ginsenosidimutans]